MFFERKWAVLGLKPVIFGQKIHVISLFLGCFRLFLALKTVPGVSIVPFVPLKQSPK